MEQRRPAVVVVIDSPAFNLRVAKEAHRRGIPVIYYVAPQFWAWRQWRARIIRKYVRKALVIFPFEVDFYRKWGVDAEFVGHPLVDLPPQVVPRADFARAHDLDAAKPWIALLPGSRRKEVLMNLPAMLQAATMLGQDYEFVLPVATTLSLEWMKEQAGKAPAPTGFRLAFGRDVHSALAHARAAVVASGTATVQAALASTPFVMVYRVSPMTYALGRPLVHLEQFGMVNLIAGEPLVPELVQGDFTAENVVRHLAPLVEEGPQRAQMLAGLAKVRELLKQGAGEESATRRAADAVLQLVP
jgi:lipid-A-disaccharide synthase